MNILVLGAGRMGLGAVHDLVSAARRRRASPSPTSTLERAQHVARARSTEASRRARSTSATTTAVVGADARARAAISCVNYWLNDASRKAAIDAGTNFCDLGGNNYVVDAELALDAEARERGINIIPDCGLAPGMVAVLVAHGAAHSRSSTRSTSASAACRRIRSRRSTTSSSSPSKG